MPVNTRYINIRGTSSLSDRFKKEKQMNFTQSLSFEMALVKSDFDALSCLVLKGLHCIFNFLIFLQSWACTELFAYLINRFVFISTCNAYTSLSPQLSHLSYDMGIV